MRVSWTARRSNQSILKEISPEYSLEGLMLKLKLQYFGHLMRGAESLEKTGKCWEILKAGGEGKGNPLQYSCLENCMDRGAWQATVYGIVESDTDE